MASCFHIFILLICLSWSEVVCKRLYLLPRVVNKCDEAKIKQHVDYSLFRLNRFDKKSFTLDIDMDIKHNFPQFMDGHVQVTRCNSYSDVNSCEFYNNITMNKLSCAMVNLNNQIWSEFIHKYEPPLRCPFKMGSYSGRNITVDVSKMSQWASGVENYYWKGEFRLRDTKTHNLLMCNNAEFEVFRSA